MDDSAPDPATPSPGPDRPTSDAPPPSAADAPRRRRWPRIVAAVVVLLGLFVALLPTLLSGTVRRAVEDGGSDALGRRLRVAGLALGWTGTVVEGLELHDGADDDPVLLRVARIEAAPRIGAAVGGRYVIDDLLIQGPELRLDLAALATRRDAPDADEPSADTAPAGGGAADAGALPPFEVTGRIRDGVVIVIHPDGREERLGSFTAVFGAARDAPASLEATLDLGPAGKVALEASAVPFRNGKAVAADALEADLGLDLENLDAAALAPLLAALGVLDRAAGRLTAALTARLDGHGVTEGSFDLAAEGLELAGGALPGPGGLVEEELKLEGGLTRAADGSLAIRECTLAAHGLSVAADVMLPADGYPVGAASGNISIKRLLERAKALGLETEAAAVGELEFDSRATSDAEAGRVTGTVRLKDVQIRPGRDRAVVSEPTVAIDLDVVRTGDAWRIDGAALRASLASADASGTFGGDDGIDLAVKLKADLERLLGVASAFGVELPGTVAGRLVAEASWRAGDDRPGAGSATVTVTDLAVTPPGEGRGTVREPEVVLTVEAVPGDERTAIRSLALRGRFATLEAEGDLAADGSDGTLRTMLDLDLGPAADLLDGLGHALPVGVTGRAGWRGPLGWSASGDGVRADGSLTLTDLVMTLPADVDGEPDRVLREASLVADVAIDRRGGDLSVERGSIAGAGLALEATGSVAGDGGLDLRVVGNVGLAEAFTRLAALGFAPRDPGTRGSLRFAATVGGDRDGPAIGLEDLATEGAPFDLAGGGRFAVDGPADLEITAGGDLGAIEGLLADAGWLAEPGGAGGTLAVRATAMADSPTAPLALHLETSVDALRMRDPAGGPAWTQERVAVTADAVWDRDAGSIAGTAGVTTDDGRIDAKGSVGLRDDRQLAAEATLDLDLAGLVRSRPSLVPLEDVVPGRLTGSARVEGPLGEPFDLVPLVAQARLELDRLKTRPFEATEVVADVVLTDGAASTRALSAKVNGGTVEGRAILALAGTRTTHELEIDVKNVAMDGALTELVARVIPIFIVGETGLVSGLLDTRLALKGEGADWDAVAPTLVGDGFMQVADGGVVSGSMITEVLSVLGKQRDLSFKTVKTAFKVHDGRVWNDRLELDGEEHAMLLQGSTTFDGRLDYAVGARAIKMGPKKRERFKPLMDENGNLPFKLRGTLSKPKVKPPDLKDLLKNAAGDAIKDKLKDLLGGD